MAPTPKADRALQSAGATESQEQLERQRRGVSAMRPQSVVPCSDTNASPEMQQNGEDQGRARQGRPVCIVDGHKRDEDQKTCLEPINVQIPIGQCPWLFGDVWSPAGHVLWLLAWCFEGFGRDWHWLEHRGGAAIGLGHGVGGGRPEDEGSPYVGDVVGIRCEGVVERELDKRADQDEESLS